MGTLSSEGILTIRSIELALQLLEPATAGCSVVDNDVDGMLDFLMGRGQSWMKRRMFSCRSMVVLYKTATIDTTKLW